MKTVLITGANGNLGTSVTKLFLEKGYQVLATVFPAGATTQMPVHNRLEMHVVDLRDETATQSFLQSAIGQKGTIDAAILLAGGFAMGTVETTGLQDIRGQIALNFETAYAVARPLLKHMMEKKWGRIVFIGSRPAIVPSQGFSTLAYGLSKSLLFRLAEYINAEAAGTNVTATVVVPSTIDTPANRQSMPKADFTKWVNPLDLANILEFIVSEKGAPLRESVIKVYADS